MHLKVKTLDNQVHSVETAPRALVSELKHILHGITSVDEARQRLIFRGRVLEDDEVLESYGIIDGNTIHMVARPRPASPTQSIAIDSSETDQLHRISSEFNHNADSFQQAQSHPIVSNNLERQAPSMEHIRQGLLTVNTLLSTINSEELDREIDVMGNLHSRNIRFYIGQWVDVKDTVSQWLEATIMDIDEELRRVFIHYNGWPTRWDEWIAFDSPRLAPFRSRTSHPFNSQLSPTPNITVPNAPLTGPNDIRQLLPELSRTITIVNNMLSELHSTSTNGVDNEAEHGHNSLDRRFPWAEQESQILNNDSVPDIAMKHRCRDLAPLLDRLGRVMTDASVCLWNYVEPGSHRNLAAPRPLDPLTTLESRLMSLLRERPPSPPPLRSYRTPISLARMDSVNAVPSVLAPSNVINRTQLVPGGNQQLDIHIAIVSPPEVRASFPSSSSLSRTMAELSASLQNQTQLIAARTQEISERVSAVSQLNATISSAIESLQSVNTPTITQHNDPSGEGTHPENNSADNDNDNSILNDLHNEPQDNGDVTLIPQNGLEDAEET